MEPKFTNKPAPGGSEPSSERESEFQHALQHTYRSLLTLQRAIDSSKDMADPNEPVEGSENDSVSGLETVSPQSFTHPSMSGEDLNESKLTFTGVLVLKPHYAERIAETVCLGQNELWSSTNLYHHLQLLENTFHIIPDTSTSAHAWIEAFFLRASAMLPQNQHMVLKMMKETVPAYGSSNLSTLSRFVDYAAIIADQRGSVVFRGTPLLTILEIYKPSTFFIIEAKDPSDHISSQVRQAVYQMFMCGKLLQNKIVRGALTNGHDWIFLLVKLNDNYEAASYKECDMIQLTVLKNLHFQPTIPKPWPDLIAAVLLHWMRNSSVDLKSDDWFYCAEQQMVTLTLS